MQRFLIAVFAVAVACAQNSADDKPQLEPLKTSITVTEKIDAEAPGVVSKLDELSIESRAGTNLDDRLRDVPGFSLFRRGSSVAAHPTTQGISLRGLASSGASRTLVLIDGLPANDPFGGWVYWSRFNPDTLDRIEVSRGASTSVYGDRAMGGAISLFTPQPEQRQFNGSLEAGNAGVVDLRGGYSDLFGPVGVSVFARGVSIDGYYIVGPEARGRVDQPARVDFVVGDVKVDYFGRGQRLALKANILAEERNNGTVLQKNSSSLGTVGLQYSREQFSLSGYHSRGEFRSAFSTVAFGRNTETPTFRQTVPSEDWGASGVWHRSTAPWNLFLGADLHHPSGESRDTLFPTGRRVGSGDLWQHGVFGQTDFALGSRARLHAGLRHDFTGRGNTFLSPSAGLVVADGSRRWRASVYRSFRAPTLNELFRAFTVGNMLTIANPDLRPETLVGGEAGVDWQTRTVLVRGTLFRNEISNLITNVTLNAATRQRQNFGSATTRGAEMEVEKV
ncbi:MAG: TonB-dependent receptor, partial [Acidobacteria bacterium]|nr:TonB-dependent receptor [Acidobacteriota bacterium]